MENVDEANIVGNEVPSGCDTSSPIGMGPDYDLQQSNLALLKAELNKVKVSFLLITFIWFFFSFCLCTC